jgi:hypothetical protein
MENNGIFTIRISGQSHGKALSPDNYDIRELAAMLINVEDILYPNAKERPIITFELEEGSVLHKFKTAMQAIISTTAIFSAIEETGNLDFLELKTAKAIEHLQKVAYQKNYTLEISSSEKKHILTISPQTKFVKTENYFVESEMYFYGEITNAGGNVKPTFRLHTSEYGTLYIQTSREYIKELEANPIYKNTGIRAKIKQNLSTGEFDRQEIHFIQLIEYNSNFDEDYLDNLIKRNKGKWDGDTDKWLKDLRGGIDA